MTHVPLNTMNGVVQEGGYKQSGKNDQSTKG